MVLVLCNEKMQSYDNDADNSVRATKITTNINNRKYRMQNMLKVQTS